MRGCALAIDIRTLEAELARFPGAVAGFPFGPQPTVFTVAGKTFAMLAETVQGARLTLKSDPVLAEALREAYPAIRPGYHTNKRHWNTIDLDGDLPEAVIWNMVQASYELVQAALPRAARDRLSLQEPPA